jgi:hypothetical protein
MDEVKVFCKDCHQELDETYINSRDRTPCPNCGSFFKEIKIQFEEKVDLHEQIKMKGKRAGIKKPVIEIISGDEIQKSTNKFVKKERMIDRENDRYFERVVAGDGEIIHEQDEKLTDHLCHGNAKFKKGSAKGAFEP